MCDMFDAVISSPFGQLALRCEAKKLVAIEFLAPTIIPHPAFEQALPLSMKAIVKQFECFFAEPGTALCVPYVLRGTPFQRRVWQALRRIPAGETRTYGELAKKLGSAPRAIGGACRANPLPILIPCHRVVSAKDLGGYAGETQGAKLEIKQWLLAHEIKK